MQQEIKSFLGKFTMGKAQNKKNSRNVYSIDNVSGPVYHEPYSEQKSPRPIILIGVLVAFEVIARNFWFAQYSGLSVALC